MLPGKGATFLPANKGKKLIDDANNNDVFACFCRKSKKYAISMATNR